MHIQTHVKILILGLACAGTVYAKDAAVQDYQFYVAPEASAQTASIVGMKVVKKFSLADQLGFVVAVDGQKVDKPRDRLEQPLVLTAGKHYLQLWCQQGSFKYSNIVSVNLEANKQYQVGTNFAQGTRWGDYCLLWVEDVASKQGVGELVEGMQLWDRADPNKMASLKEYREAVQQPATIYSPIYYNNR